MTQLIRGLLLVWAILFAGLYPLPADAQVPQLSAVPPEIPEPPREALSRRRAELADRLTALRAKMQSHNQRCGRVPADTPLAAECRSAMGALQAEISAHAEDVRRFNEAVAEALALRGREPGPQRARFLSDAEEVKLGGELAREVESGIELIRDPQVNAYAQDLVRRLAAHSPRSGIAYTVKVVKSNEVNAFALPGGYLYVNSGLIKTAANESELAAVLAHEISHVTARHHSEEIVKIAVSLGVGFLHGPLGPLVQKLVYLKFNRDQEREADQLAVDILYETRIRPTGMVTFFEKMRRAQGVTPGILDTYFSTHPTDEERIQNTARLLADPRFQRAREIDSPAFQNARGRLTSSP